jgi:hypothetical protein
MRVHVCACVCICVHVCLCERVRERESESVNRWVASGFARLPMSVCVCESLPGSLWALQHRELEDTDRGNRGRGLTQAEDPRRSLPCHTLSRLVAFFPFNSLPILFSSHCFSARAHARPHTYAYIETAGNEGGGCERVEWMRSRLVFLPVSYLVPDCHLRRMAHLVLWCCSKCNFKVGQCVRLGISISLFCLSLALFFLLWLVRLHVFSAARTPSISWSQVDRLLQAQMQEAHHGEECEDLYVRHPSGPNPRGQPQIPQSSKKTS